MIITIDGPSASGKSTVAKALAKRLGFYYLYTGLIYRAVAYVALSKLNKFELSPEELKFIFDISYQYVDGAPKVFFQNEDITEKLSSSELGKGASVMGANKYVRDNLLDLQRAVASSYDIVADGRDCGSVVFPNADYKFFLTASLEVRAKRAFLDKARKNTDVTLEEMQKIVSERDKRDKERTVSPLIVPEDAIIIDNSGLDIEQTLEKFLDLIKIPSAH